MLRTSMPSSRNFTMDEPAAPAADTGPQDAAARRDADMMAAQKAVYGGNATSRADMLRQINPGVGGLADMGPVRATMPQRQPPAAAGPVGAGLSRIMPQRQAPMRIGGLNLNPRSEQMRAAPVPTPRPVTNNVAPQAARQKIVPKATGTGDYIDADAYLAAYPDLMEFYDTHKGGSFGPGGETFSNPQDFARDHYQRYGQAEGRTANLAARPTGAEPAQQQPAAINPRDILRNVF